MDIFNVLELIGGLAMFLFGMNVLSSNLTKLSGGKLEKTLQKLTSSPLKGIILGAGITIAIQSSSAMTVMLVGLVNSGVMQLEQTISVIMGSNIGTTLTAWLLGLTGIQSTNVFIRLLKPDSFAPVVAIIGIVFIMMSKSERKRDVGNIMVGFAVLMFGMSMMSGAVSPLGDSPQFAEILLYFNNPLLGVVTGTIFTGIIQSSAASVGILQVLCATGNITYATAVPVILGQNIGTCATSALACIGVNKNAKRVSMVHVLFNLIGTIVFLVLFYGLNSMIKFSFFNDVASPFGIALFHSIFNIFTTLILLPCRKLLVYMAEKIIRDDVNKEEKFELLDELLLITPPLAVERSKNVANDMLKDACDVLIGSMELINNYDKEKALELWKKETNTDVYEDKLGSYLIKIGSKAISEKDSKQISMLLEDIVDFERIGDHGANIMNLAKEMHDKEIAFSPYAQSELKVISDAVYECLNLVSAAFENMDVSIAKQVEPLEQVVDNLRSSLRDRHTQRLLEGICTMETGILFLDLINNLERVSDHCSNIAVNLIKIVEGDLDAHEYLGQLRNSGNVDYDTMYAGYSAKYKLEYIPYENI